MTPGEYSDWWLVQSEHIGAYIQESTPPKRLSGWRVLPVPEAVIQEVPARERHVWTPRLASKETDVFLEGHRMRLDTPSVSPVVERPRLSFIGAAWRLACLWDACLTTWHRVFHPVGIGFLLSGERFCLRCRRSYRTPFAPNDDCKYRCK